MARGFSRFATAALCVVAIVAAAAPAHARQTTNTLPASVRIFAGCSLQTRPLMFVTPNATINVVVDATTTITVKCTPNTNFTVDIDKGLHNNGINRRMYSPTANAYVSYDIYRNGPRTAVWGTGQLRNVSGNSGGGAPLDIVLYGRIPISGKIKAGDYHDQLVVTLNF